MAIMSDKTQCKSCEYYATVPGFESCCCKCFDENGRIIFAKRAKRSNCWCLDYSPNGKEFNKQPFHIIGQYFTERYGIGVTLQPLVTGGANFGINKVTRFKITVESPKLKSIFYREFSIDEVDRIIQEIILEEEK